MGKGPCRAAEGGTGWPARNIDDVGGYRRGGRRIARAASLEKERAGFTGIHTDLLADLGILYIKNSLSTAASQKALYDIASSIPPTLQIVERVTQDDFLQTAT
jgi:hypothetical protein